MYRDLNTAETEVHFATEVCIIGTGIAGITAGRRLLELGHTVVLLESGGLDYEPMIANLNEGENIGEAYYDLEETRLRLFGGTTAIWGGRIAELDPIDLEARPWVPHSGWPFRWSELAKYYAPARRIFDVPEASTTSQDLRLAGVNIPDFDPNQIEVGAWVFDRKFNRFVFDACQDLVNHPRCTIVTHATVTDLVLDSGGHRLTSLTARSLSGRMLTITPKAVVLAAGGLENPRLLLTSRSVARRGIGNDFDQVGRYFMEHPHARGGRVLTENALPLLRVFQRTRRPNDRELAAVIKPGAKLQQDRGILNTALTVVARQPADASQSLAQQTYMKIKHNVAPTRGGRALWMTTKKVARWSQRQTGALRPWLLCKFGFRELTLSIRAEQAPNPDSRVLLTDQCDPLGMPRLALDWQTTRLDVDSVAGLVDALDRELRRLDLGRVEPAAWLKDVEAGWHTDPLIGAHPIGGYHHMGTTRMSDDAKRGATDGHGRVHGLENLYVAGSSVFPTCGWANPTLTIAALTLRTSEHVSSRLARVATMEEKP